MRLSPLRHPLAVLRKTIGLNQQELADLSECSPRTIQAVELLKLPLSGKLATKLSAATGVSIESLLDADPSAPLRTGHSPAWASTGDCFTAELFERHRACVELRDRDRSKSSLPTFEETFRGQKQDLLLQPPEREVDESDREILDLCENLLRAIRDHEQNFVIRWQVKRFLSKKFAQYGVSLPAPQAGVCSGRMD